MVRNNLKLQKIVMAAEKTIRLTSSHGLNRLSVVLLDRGHRQSPIGVAMERQEDGSSKTETLSSTPTTGRRRAHRLRCRCSCHPRPPRRRCGRRSIATTWSARAAFTRTGVEGAHRLCSSASVAERRVTGWKRSLTGPPSYCITDSDPWMAREKRILMRLAASEA